MLQGGFTIFAKKGGFSMTMLVMPAYFLKWAAYSIEKRQNLVPDLTRVHFTMSFIVDVDHNQ